MFFPIIIYFELFIALFFLPGFFITVILGIKKFRFLLSFALSYSLLVLTLLPFEYYARPIAMWQWCVLLEWAILAVWAVAKTLMYRSFSLGRAAQPVRPGDMQRDRLSFPTYGNSCRRRNLILYLLNPRLLVPLVLAGMICGYLAYAGIYLEIPSDAWNHVSLFQWQKLSVIDNGAFSSDSSFNSLLFTQGSGSNWYFMHAWLCQVSSIPIMGSLHILTFVNVLIFLLAIYYFGLFLFAGLRISTFRKMMMAAIASLFAATTMGNMVFAYIRYYAFAPAILNYVLFLAAMAVITTWLRSNRWFGCAHHRWSGHALWIAPVLLIVTNAIHTQEALFIFFMTLALGLLGTIRLLWRTIFGRHGQSVQINNTNHQIAVTTERDPPNKSLFLRWKDALCRVRWTVSEWKYLIMAGILLLVLFAGFAAIRYFKPGVWLSPHMIMPHANIPVEPVIFIFRNLTISMPENPYLRLAVYQFFVFYSVVGCWGLFVYLLFGIMIRRFVKLPYLMAGMIIVLFLTIFHPFTIDLMVRMGQSAALYRFIYLIPLPFIGGYLFVHFWCKAREWSQKMRAAPVESVSPIWVRLFLLNFAGSILVLAGLIGLIFPINVAGIYAPYSKIYTLRKIPAGNDYHLYDDPGKIMAKYENKVVLTDGYTAYFIAFYSPKNTYCHAAWLNSSNPEKEPPEPYTWENLRNRGLIIINRRDGALSVTGKITKHWPEDAIQKVSRHYSLETQHYLESHPELFQKIWSRDRIAVYTVR